MTYASLFDLPSLLFVLSSVIIGFIVAHRDLSQSLALGRDLAIPIGIYGSTLSFVMMLSSLEDPSKVASAMSVALLPMIYGLALSALLAASAQASQSLEIKNAHSTAELFTPLALVGCGLLLLLAPALVIIKSRHVAILINGPAGIMVVAGLILAALIGRDVKEKVVAASRCTLLIALSALLCSVSLLITAWGDPTSIGPVMALGILSLMYSCLIYACAQVLYRAGSGASLPQTALKSTALSVIAFIVLIGGYLVVVYA